VQRDVSVSRLDDDVASFAIVDGVYYCLVPFLRPFIRHDTNRILPLEIVCNGLQLRQVYSETEFSGISNWRRSRIGLFPRSVQF